MNANLDLFALSASVLALFFIFRTKKRYFFDTRFFMALANVAFSISLIQNVVSDLYGLAPSSGILIQLIAMMAGSIACASYAVPRGGEKLRRSQSTLVLQLFGKAPRGFTIFLALLLSWTIISLSVPSWKPMQIQTLEGSVYYFTYDSWYITLSTILLASFLVLPIRFFYQKSAEVSDPKAARSMKIIAVCWGCFGITTFSQTALAQISVLTIRTVAAVLDSMLFLLIAAALKEPTVLGRIITPLQETIPSLRNRTRSDTVLLYNVESDRKPLIVAFVKEAVMSDREVLCLVAKAEIPFYTALVRSILAAMATNRRLSVNVEAIESILSQQSPSEFDRSQSSKTRREVIDLYELDEQHCSEIIERLTSIQSGPVDGRIWAVNSESPGASLLRGLIEKTPSMGLIDVAGQQRSFSKLLNMKHEDLLGKRVLVEYEPTALYEDIIANFVNEFQANGESTSVFTSVGSPIYRLVNEIEGLRIFGFSTKTSTPAKISEQTVLLPEHDASLLLDALDKLIRASSGNRIGIIFDVFTDLILSQGFEKAYSPLSSVVEMSESPSITTLFLVNEAAVDRKSLNGVRGLFSFQLRLDAGGVTVIVGASSSRGSLGHLGFPGLELERPVERGHVHS